MIKIETKPQTKIHFASKQQWSCCLTGREKVSKHPQRHLQGSADSVHKESPRKTLCPEQILPDIPENVRFVHHVPQFTH